MAGAIAVRFTLVPKEKKLIPMSLSWDLPVVQFGGGRKWIRHYGQFFDASGTNAWKIARTALENNHRWSDEIGSRLLFPYAGSLRCARNVPRRHVYEAWSDLVDGNACEVISSKHCSKR